MRFILLVLSLSFIIPSYCEAFFRVDFKVAKMHGLYNFIETVSGDSQKSQTLKEIFTKSKYNNLSTKRLIEEFQKLREPLYHNWNYKGYPPDRHMGQSLRNIIFIASAFSENLGEFSQRTLGIMPVDIHTRLFKNFAKFEKIYDRLIWEPNYGKLKKYTENIRELSKKWELNVLFLKALVFYEANWPKNTPFVVALYPIPGTHGHSSGESVGVLQSVGVLIDENNIPERFGIIFHEICHALYESQNKIFQKKFEAFYTKSDSMYARYAYHYINEGLATALGNGWAYKMAKGSVDEGSWYNDEYINGFAKAIYPKVKEYVDSNRVIDKNFTDFTIKEFEKVFPDAPYEYATLMNKIFVLSEEEILKGQKLRKLLNPHFRVSSIRRNSPIDHEKSLGNLHLTEETIVILVSEKNKAQLKMVAKEYKPLSAYLDRILKEKSDSILSAVDKNGRAFIVLKFEDKKRLSEAFSALKTLKRVNSREPLNKF